MTIGKTFPDAWEELGLDTDPLVYEVEEEIYSSLLGPNGQRLRYEPIKQGFIGFWRLDER